MNDLGPPTSQTAALGVPPDLAKQFPHIFVPVLPSGHPEKTHMLSVVQLVPLQEVFVRALSSTAYSRAKADVSSFEDWLCRGQRILRQDSVYVWDTPDDLDPGALAYKLIMTEPVLQGYAQKSQTLFTLLPPLEGSQAVNGNQVLSSSVPDDVQIDEDEEGLEIGENFLASSLISQPSSYPQHSPPIRMSRLAHEFTANPLPKPTSLDVDEHTMYVRTVDLPKVGVLDGDWVSINLEIWKENLSNRCQAIARLPLSRNRRIVRLEANDELVGDSYDPYVSQFIVSN
jgi:peroxin-6